MIARAAALLHLARPCSGRASPRAASSRSLAASPPAVRSSRASPTSPKRPVSPQPIVYGGADSKSYIIEVVGCGVAFLDYDNDGWLDLLVLSGTRLGGRAARDDQPPVQEQPRRHVHRRHREGRPDADGWASGGDRRRLRQRRLRRPVRHLLRPERPVPQQRRRHVHRRHRRRRACCRRRSRYGSGCTWVDYDRDGRLDLFVANYLDTTLEKLPKPGENADCRWKGVPVNCGPRGLPPGRRPAVSQQRRRHVHRRQPSSPASRRRRRRTR